MVADHEPLNWKEAPDFLSVEECCRLLRSGERQVRRLLKDQTLEVRVGHNVRVPKDALKAWVDEQVRTGLDRSLEDLNPDG